VKISRLLKQFQNLKPNTNISEHFKNFDDPRVAYKNKAFIKPKLKNNPALALQNIQTLANIPNIDEIMNDGIINTNRILS
jgi:hypothetical protein